MRDGSCSVRDGRSGAPHLALYLVLVALVTACASHKPEPEWGRPLPEGARALLPLGPGDKRPDLAAQWERRDELLAAVELTLPWFDKPSSKAHFPVEGVTLQRAKDSVLRFREILLSANGAADFARRVEADFEVFKSAGWDAMGGGVLYTGYFTPILDGRRERGGAYQYPLYALPPDLVKDAHGTTLGRKSAAGALSPYPDRQAIETGKLLDGQGLELVWLGDPLDAYIAHVNGSAVIRMGDGSLMRLGYAGKNGHDYVSLRDALLAEKQLTSDDSHLPGIRKWAGRNPPEKVLTYLHRNPSYVFFTPIDGRPRGSLNVEVTPEITLATDKRLFPRGGLVFVDTALPGIDGRGKLDYQRLMLDQDTGGAIRTAGRADIYLGVGPLAARRAGSTRAEGQLYYFFLKPGKTAGAAPAATDAPPEESTPIEDAASAAVG